MVNAFHHPSERSLTQSADNFIWDGDRRGEKRGEIKKKDKKGKK